MREGIIPKMKYTVKYQAKDDKGVEFVFTETFDTKNNYRGNDAFVWKEQMLADIKKVHPTIKELIILDCDTRVWSGMDGSDDDSCLSGPEIRFR